MKFFKIINRIIIFFLFFVLIHCQNYPGFETGPESKSQFKEESQNLDVYYSYGNISYNPIPLGVDPIKSVFISDSLWSSSTINIILSNPVELQFENQLSWNSFRSFINFFNNYITQNNIPINNYYKIIYTFGLQNISSSPNNVYGFTNPFYHAQLDSVLSGYPAMNFVFVGKLNTSFSQYNQTLRNKFIEFTTSHEISHSRGLLNLNSFDHPHQCHKDQNGLFDGSCNMQLPYNTFWGNPDYFYPSHLCYLHRRIMQDSLRNFIKNGLFLGESCQ